MPTWGRRWLPCRRRTARTSSSSFFQAEDGIRDIGVTEFRRVLFRSQEALANVTKHARATKVRVEIQRNSSNVRCSISDNGQGMDVPAVLRRQGERGLGLIGIRERLDPFRGTVDLKSAPGRGTEVIISLVDHVSTDRGV